MSDARECCVCYEETEHLTPCNHLVRESCYSQVPTCPMCRASLGNGSIEEGGSEEEEDSDFDIDESNQGMFEAALFGHFRLMLFRGANNYNTGLMTAALRGQLDIVLLMLLQGADDFNGAMAMAAHRGHEDIVRLMLFKGANNYNTGLTSAASEGHESIVRLTLELGANDFNVAMVRASLRGHQNIVELIRESMD